MLVQEKRESSGKLTNGIGKGMPRENGDRSAM
jgi:hypothetical protein